jgi:integrase
LLCISGLREGELLALRWEDVNLEATKPALLVRRTLTRGENERRWVIGISTKSGKGRRVRLTWQAVEALKDHRKRQLEEKLRLAGLWQDHDSCFPASSALYSTPLTCAIDPSDASRPALASGKIYASTICATPVLRCS